MSGRVVLTFKDAIDPTASKTITLGYAAGTVTVYLGQFVTTSEALVTVPVDTIPYLVSVLNTVVRDRIKELSTDNKPISSTLAHYCQTVLV